VEKKGPLFTIEAFASIALKYPSARLDMVGDGPLRDQCQALIANRGLQNRAILHGEQDSDFVAALLQNACIFVQHSITSSDGDVESFGVSLVEAMAASVPVVTTKHNGFVDTVADGVTGILVEERDVSGMADAIERLLGNPSLGAAMGAAGRARVLERFTMESTADQLRSIMGFKRPVNDARNRVAET
jgi:glycosyltransferase involved in cell wall biosynthesis